MILVWVPPLWADDVRAYVVLRARAPSLSFYPLQSGCCPALHNGSASCCPLHPARSSLQVEALVPGVSYRFKLLTVGPSLNFTSEATTALAAATVPAPPSALSLSWSAQGAPSLSWSSPADGGAPIRGYRIHAIHASSSAVGAAGSLDTTVTNTSSDATTYTHLVLLPGHAYSLTVHAINAVGVGAPSAALSVVAPMPASAEYELALGRWARGALARGAGGRHRIFVPAASEELRVRAQQLSGDALSTRQLQLLLCRGAEPPLPGEAAPASAVVHRNDSAWGGALSLHLTQPRSGWYHILVLAAAAQTDRAEYDLHVAVRSGADAVLAAAGIAETCSSQRPKAHSICHVPY